ncbi:hypothetical protein BJX64DRAFT_250845 [Aspergillus heterothallicus]
MHPLQTKYEFNLSELPTFQGPPDILPHRDVQECIICLEPILSTSVLRKLPCTHLFHQSCVDDWVCNFSPRCPICRRTIYCLRGPRKSTPGLVETRQGSSSTQTGSHVNDHIHGTFYSLKHWCKKRLSGHAQGTVTNTDSSPAEQRQQAIWGQ